MNRTLALLCYLILTAPVLAGDWQDRLAAEFTPQDKPANAAGAILQDPACLNNREAREKAVWDEVRKERAEERKQLADEKKQAARDRRMGKTSVTQYQSAGQSRTAAAVRARKSYNHTHPMSPMMASMLAWNRAAVMRANTPMMYVGVARR